MEKIRDLVEYLLQSKRVRDGGEGEMTLTQNEESHA